MGIVYDKIREFKNKYPMTIAWRLKRHAKVVELHLNSDEEVIYAFVAQKNDNPLDIVTTYAIVLTDKRIIVASKRLLFGYFLTSITPDMFNDLNVKMGMIWGKIYVDTVKEVVKLSNIQREALPEIEQNLTDYMLEAKKRNADNNEQ